ncbi:hypothetical protein F5880DRAFT_1612065 [Lentinula raphanica]|nr:hypothetical protein F5880DRAFT_1612065 [Lentinula raphanica]
MSSPIFNLSRRCIGPQRFSQLFPSHPRLFSNISSLQTSRKSFASTTWIPSSVFKAVGLSGLGLGLSLYFRPFIRCEPTTASPSPASSTQSGSLPPPPPPPEIRILGVTKGAKAVAFFLGGVFVLLKGLQQVR